ncbi:MAG: sugar nucleotide-binding protein [Neisseriaceae bacterium]|nr:MAG: sugar nucleotide-binding protein [Neisseriaceae bacterium]
MHILITGANGQLGQSIVPILEPFHHISPFSKYHLDITHTDLLKDKLTNLKPEYILNFAAYNHVDLAQKELKKCDEINHLAVKKLASLTYQYGIGLIHISSNYVFSGECDHLYTEQEIAQPINYYGLSKYRGEQTVLQENPQAIIIRTSSLYSPFRNNFMTKIVRQIKEKKTISVVNDAYTQPTSCHSLALFIQYILEQKPELSGIIHFTDDKVYSWYEYAQVIALTCSQYLPLSANIIPIQASPKSIRPKYALLDNSFRKDFFDNQKMKDMINSTVIKIISME